jgi:hypothetical protein
MVDFSLSARGVMMTILNGRAVSSSETEVRNVMKRRKHMYFHQLNGRKLLVAFNSAISKELQVTKCTARFRI